MKLTDDSDVDDCHSDDDGIDHSQKEPQRSPKLPVAKELEPFDFEE